MKRCPQHPPYLSPKLRSTAEVIPAKTLAPATIEAKSVPISSDEIARAQLGVDARAMRFYFFGEIIYDDFFGYRHTQGFCFKVMRHGWHGAMGGDAYNYKRREAIPPQTRVEALPAGQHGEIQ